MVVVGLFTKWHRVRCMVCFHVAHSSACGVWDFAVRLGGAFSCAVGAFLHLARSGLAVRLDAKPLVSSIHHVCRWLQPVPGPGVCKNMQASGSSPFLAPLTDGLPLVVRAGMDLWQNSCRRRCLQSHICSRSGHHIAGSYPGHCVVAGTDVVGCTLLRILPDVSGTTLHARVRCRCAMLYTCEASTCTARGSLE